MFHIPSTFKNIVILILIIILLFFLSNEPKINNIFQKKTSFKYLFIVILIYLVYHQVNISLLFIPILSIYLIHHPNFHTKIIQHPSIQQIFSFLYKIEIIDENKENDNIQNNQNNLNIQNDLNIQNNQNDFKESKEYKESKENLLKNNKDDFDIEQYLPKVPPIIPNKKNDIIEIPQIDNIIEEEDYYTPIQSLSKQNTSEEFSSKEFSSKELTLEELEELYQSVQNELMDLEMKNK